MEKTITSRDLFAAYALPAIIQEQIAADGYIRFAETARRAFAVADAMMERRAEADAQLAKEVHQQD